MKLLFCDSLIARALFFFSLKHAALPPPRDLRSNAITNFTQIEHPNDIVKLAVGYTRTHTDVGSKWDEWRKYFDGVRADIDLVRWHSRICFFFCILFYARKATKYDEMELLSRLQPNIWFYFLHN